MAKLWKFLSVSIVAAVCLGLMLVPAVPNVALAQPALNCGLEVEPSMTNVGFNTSFSVNVSITNPTGEELDMEMVHINFTKDLIEVVSIDAGSAVGSPFTTQYDKTFSNTDGTLDVDYSTPSGTNTTASNPIVCTINMQSKSTNGVATLDFIAVDAWGDPDTAVIGKAAEHLNWTMVVNGMVKVGGPPAISVSPDNLTFNAIEGGENPPAQTLEVCNSGVGTLSWSLTDNAGWLSETPTSGSLGEGGCEDVTVSVDVTGMEAGDYSATITITGSPVVQVAVSLHIESAVVPIPGGPAGFSASAVSISPQQVEPGEEVTISINVANTGGETGSYNAILYINGVVEDSQSVSVAGGTSRNVIFTVSKSKAGVYDVSLAGQTGQFQVVGGGWFGGGLGLGTGGIIVVVVAVIVLIVGLFLIRRGTRRET